MLMKLIFFFFFQDGAAQVRGLGRVLMALLIVLLDEDSDSSFSNGAIESLRQVQRVKSPV